METFFCVVGGNLTVAYFDILPQIYPKDFVDFFYSKLLSNFK